MNGNARDLDRRWFKRFGRTDDRARIRVFCWHHAGGTAAQYRAWPRLLPPEVEPIAVQLPGRADRFAEPAIDRMTLLVDEFAEVVEPALDRPYALFGTSMGARVARAVAYELRERGLPPPQRLYVACDPAPDTDRGDWPWENRDDGLIGYLREMGGTPPEVLDQPELLRALLPPLRADLTVISTDDFRPDQPLDLPIVGFAGVADPVGTPELMARWSTETTAGFELHRLPCGHFLAADAEAQVIRTIVRELL
ncbi:thioesterase II family protein [Nocardia sp. alder85J]|uniref:thioesterase II family protein n=1 Tax=Nocardia sp. alder85J TaxID=2862949 RepID=UPI001CD28654|nr:thioesterase domain-containing protein [Nocardia sp. alder85J]MCX4091632.1 alpha/beta fold hydrolase [Nocardia sp. alder85J]